jgi:hypothetical protein
MTMGLDDAVGILHHEINRQGGQVPNFLLVHLGTNSIEKYDWLTFINRANEVMGYLSEMCQLKSQNSTTKFQSMLWSDVIPRVDYHTMTTEVGFNFVQTVNGGVHMEMLSKGHYYVEHPSIVKSFPHMHFNTFRKNDKHNLTWKGSRELLKQWDIGLRKFIFNK